MSYQQIREILVKIEGHHAELRKTIDNLLAEKRDGFEENGRWEWLKKYVEKQSQSISLVLAQLKSQSGNNVLETWLQYVPEDEVERDLNEMRSASEMGWDELLEHLQDFDHALQNLYAALADQSSIPDVKVLFESLGKVSQHFLEQKAWGMRSEEDASTDQVTQTD